mmetsp:Transcript_5573/g.8546  ORF Transcript_5573/g.8546 Transcript_5573/m.8546 type:complete len:83 (+) Transcript_5573:1354-1602(+)
MCNKKFYIDDLVKKNIKYYIGAKYSYRDKKNYHLQQYYFEEMKNFNYISAKKKILIERKFGYKCFCECSSYLPRKTMLQKVK